MPQQLDSTVSTASSGTSLSAASTAAIAPKDFWWQWPCSSARLATGLSGSLSVPAAASRARNSSNNNACDASSARVLALDQRRDLVAEAEHAARLEPDDGNSARDEGRERRDAALRLAPRLIDQPDREKRAPAAERPALPSAGFGRCTPYPAAVSTASAASMFSGSK